jgi:epoxyqueuosine reductase
MVDNLTQALHDFAKRKEIDLLGVTNADDIVCLPSEYDSDPAHYAPCRRTKIRDNTYSPKVIMKSVKAVIITGMYMFGFDKIIPGTLGCPRGNIGPWTRAYVEAGRYATDQVMSFLQNMGYKAVFTNELPYRTLAVKCGLGSIGKNGFLYHEKMGSYIRMGCVLTDAPLETEDHGTQSSNTCGKCNICINACPTGALRGQNDYDADYCLHLWLQGQGIYGENKLILKIKDNGIGVEPQLIEKLQSGEYAPKNTGIGLSNIISRLELIYGSEGKLKIYNASPRGCIVEVVVPIKVGHEKGA